MTAKELAQTLNGRRYGHEIFRAEMREAAASGLVVVCGASDDLVNLYGAWREEVDAWLGATIFINADGIAPRIHGRGSRKVAAQINAYWRAGGVPWTFHTTILHETFDIFEDGELFCRGIVFSVDDVR